MRKLPVIALFAAGLSIAGCEQTGVDKQTVGGLTGAALGGLLGSQFGSGSGQLAMTAAGAVLGGLLGSGIGSSLDKADRLALQQTTQQSLETAPDGVRSSWSNPNSGNKGYVQPTRTYTSNGRNCREFTQSVVVNGKRETARGTACRNSDGTWTTTSS